MVDTSISFPAKSLNTPSADVIDTTDNFCSTPAINVVLDNATIYLSKSVASDPPLNAKSDL